jgi:hypothetical protein
MHGEAEQKHQLLGDGLVQQTEYNECMERIRNKNGWQSSLPFSVVWKQEEESILRE